MIKRAAATLLAALALAACSGGGAATQQPGPTAAATTGATSVATQGGGGTEVDPNTVAGFCQLMADTITANWPPKDSAAATLISPFLRSWAAVAEFKDVAPELLALADWTASMSIMNPVPAPPAEVATAWDKVTAFRSSHCAA